MSAQASVAEFQRNRIVAATIQIADEGWVREDTVTHVVKRAGVSRRAFYEHFDDRDACFRAALYEIVARAVEQAGPVYRAQTKWADRMRAGLRALLEYFDEQPGLASFCVVRSATCGPATLAARADVVAQLTRLVGEGAHAGRVERVLPPLTAAGVVGGALEIVHARLLKSTRPQLLGLLNPLMSIIVLPYLGPAAARRELARVVPRRSTRRRTQASRDVRARLGMRLTERTLRALTAIAAEQGLSNREVGDRAGIADQAQICKLLSRMAKLGLIENTGHGQAHGAANAWRLRASGRELLLAVGHRMPETQ
jgi:AcrR family transcriptional regulator/DNA-binding MarR family transcriptional regulator